jgi:hypothetical protein
MSSNTIHSLTNDYNVLAATFHYAEVKNASYHAKWLKFTHAQAKNRNEIEKLKTNLNKETKKSRKAMTSAPYVHEKILKLHNEVEFLTPWNNRVVEWDGFEDMYLAKQRKINVTRIPCALRQQGCIENHKEATWHSNEFDGQLEETIEEGYYTSNNIITD